MIFIYKNDILVKSNITRQSALNYIKKAKIHGNYYEVIIGGLSYHLYNESDKEKFIDSEVK